MSRRYSDLFKSLVIRDIGNCGFVVLALDEWVDGWMDLVLFCLY